MTHQFLRATVHEELCSGTGLCTRICPEVFELRNGWSHATQDPVPAELEPSVREAAHLCPLQAIDVIEGEQ